MPEVGFDLGVVLEGLDVFALARADRAVHAMPFGKTDPDVLRPFQLVVAPTLVLAVRTVWADPLILEGAFTAELTRELRGSDFVHWGEGTISVSSDAIVHQGNLAPGPDYKLYLVPEFVEHEDEFLPIKSSAQLIGDVKTFDGFIVNVPEGVDVTSYTTVLVWCEAFSEFITAAQYR